MTTRGRYVCYWFIIFLGPVYTIRVPKFTKHGCVRQGRIHTNEHWHGFLFGVGLKGDDIEMHVEIEFPLRNDSVTMLMYRHEQLKTLRRLPNCTDKVMIARGANQRVDFSVGMREADCRRNALNTRNLTIVCTLERRFSHKELMRWHLALANCKSATGLGDVSYSFWFNKGAVECWDIAHAGKLSQCVFVHVLSVMTAFLCIKFMKM